MSKRRTGVSKYRKSRSPKTKKRLEIKRIRLEALREKRHIF